MNDGGATLALLGRALFSLLLVTGLIVGAYFAIRRQRERAGRMPARTKAKAAGSSRRALLGGMTRAQRHQLVVLSRVATSRTSGVSAVRFGDRVLLVGTTEQAAAQVLAEMPLEEWERNEAIETTGSATAGGALHPASLQGPDDALPAQGRTPMGQFIEALRTATARHA